MRLGVISDVHANRVALEGVLAAMDPVDALVCAGDVVGYNPWPGECVDRVGERCVATVEGNHDRNVDTPNRYRHNRMAHAGLELARDRLRADQRAWLRALPRTVECADGRVLVVHDHPEHRDRYVYPGEFPALEPYLADYDAIVLGHTHVQAAERLSSGLVVNPGSVGQPRDGDPRAAYAVLEVDDDAVQVELHRVEYDVAAVREAIAAAELPERTGRRLERGE